MHRAIPIALLVAALGACRGAAAPITTHASTPAEIAAHSTPAIVSIRTPHGLGTGFVVRGDGWVATNMHVIAGEPEATVVFNNERELPIDEVITFSRDYDLAIVRIAAKDLPVLPLGDSDRVRPGERVVAIGHPLGLEDTVSDGLISAVRRLGDATVLQISAPIAPGSSGGPIFNDRGEVIGVATAIIQGGQNLNLGVPIRYLKPMLNESKKLSLAKFAELTSDDRADRVAGVAEAQGEDEEPKLPKVDRHVPKHPLSILDGCDEGALKQILTAFEETVDLGVILYNRGHFRQSYDLFAGLAVDVEARLPKSCPGPAKALADGRNKAGSLEEPAAQAWAMRDAIDGLLDVILRKVRGVHNGPNQPTSRTIPSVGAPKGESL